MSQITFSPAFINTSRWKLGTGKASINIFIVAESLKIVGMLRFLHNLRYNMPWVIICSISKTQADLAEMLGLNFHANF